MNDLEHLAEDVVRRAAAAGIMVTSAESCTGGMVAAALTDIAGASAVLDRGVVTYSNCLLYTSPSPRDEQSSRMPSSA